MLKSLNYRDLECVQLSNDSISLLATVSVGPRLLELRFTGGENILADLPDAILESTGGDPLRLLGGHRLWYAPEIPQRTYIPDNEPVMCTETENGVHLVQKIEEATGIQKSMRVLLPDDRAIVVIDHQLTNYGLKPIDCAPWAITQMRPKGVAILPHPFTEVDPHGVRPNRTLVLWPYTDINHSSIRWGNDFTFIRAELEEGAIKIGFPNPRGWLAYQWKNILFVKRAQFFENENYFDQNSSSQCYCNPNFLELETLGPSVQLDPGESISHREIWEMYSVEVSKISEGLMQTLVDQLGLDQPCLFFDLNHKI